MRYNRLKEYLFHLYSLAGLAVLPIRKTHRTIVFSNFCTKASQVRQ